MKSALLVSQSQDGSYVNILFNALQRIGYSLSVISGKLTDDINSKVEKVQSVKYDSTSFRSRLMTWRAFIKDSRQYVRNNIEKYDLFIFTSNPPINQSIVQYVQNKGKKTVYMVWDIYPDTIERAFGWKVKAITTLWRGKNHEIYRKCNAVLTIGEVMKNVLQESYPDIPFLVVPYHTDCEFIHPINKKENSFAIKHKLVNKTVFMYSGKMGYGHDLKIILDAAEKLKYREDIEFVFIGFGSSFDGINKMVKEKKMSNTLVLPYQPIEVLPYSLGSADVSFITIKNGNEGVFLPSKVYDAMASGAAIICISNGRNDVSKLVDDYDIGVTIKCGDVEALIKAIASMATSQEELRKKKEKSRKVSLLYNKDNIECQYIEIFGDAVRG